MDERTVVGVVGAGRIGRVHAENLAFRLAPQARLAAIADPRLEAAQTLARHCQMARATTEWRELVADPAIQAIVVCSPTDTHADIIEAAAAARKHIFCEKPIALDLARTERALGAVALANVVFQVGFNRRFDSSFERVARGVRAGEIGTVQLLRITSRDPEPPPAEYVRSSGGLFLDMTIHDFDMARFVLDDEVVEVQACGASLVDPAIGRAGDIDTAIVTLRFARGALGCIDNVRRAVYGYDQRLEVLGARGALVATHAAPTTVSRWEAAGLVGDRPHAFFLERYADAYVSELRAFLDCVRNQKLPPVTGADGLQALRIALAARQSLQTGRPVAVDGTLAPEAHHGP